MPPRYSITHPTRLYRAENMTNSRSNIIKRMDKHIKMLEEQLCIEKQQRNALAPIAEIPGEILAMIFTLVANDDIPCPSTLLSQIESFDRLSPAIRYNFSAVCQDWRDISMNNPSMWNIITTSRLWWSELVLSRSKASSLSVYAMLVEGRGQSHESAFFVQVIRNHIPRIKELILAIGHDVVIREKAQEILDTLPASLPLLQNLQIDVGFHQGRTSNYPTIPKGCLVDAQLSTLYLKGCDIDWKAPFIVGPLPNAQPGDFNP
ncbi:hypothetical protein CPB83DRAFT_900982 [Crepidotus variabilis]|uniref:F-box domain-containing protein n=1 Tax=Crepidotus variabilis TaxID=179855 RepID=A0A9P6E2L7_9AGAR|nr:hypothetical protein CPB83DRAFT_900982 [Crepidotus variabilis]